MYDSTARLADPLYPAGRDRNSRGPGPAAPALVRALCFAQLLIALERSPTLPIGEPTDPSDRHLLPIVSAAVDRHAPGLWRRHDVRADVQATKTACDLTRKLLASHRRQDSPQTTTRETPTQVQNTSRNPVLSNVPNRQMRPMRPEQFRAVTTFEVHPLTP